MNRQELIEHIAAETGETKSASGRFLDAFIHSVQAAVAAGGKVTLAGFGSFETITTQSRRGRNPHTGEIVTIDASVRPKFSPGSNFRALVKSAKEA